MTYEHDALRGSSGTGADADATFANRGDHPLEFLRDDEREELIGLIKVIPQTVAGVSGLDSGGLAHTTVAELDLPYVRYRCVSAGAQSSQYIREG